MILNIYRDGVGAVAVMSGVRWKAITTHNRERQFDNLTTGQSMLAICCGPETRSRALIYLQAYELQNSANKFSVHSDLLIENYYEPGWLVQLCKLY